LQGTKILSVDQLAAWLVTRQSSLDATDAHARVKNFTQPSNKPIAAIPFLGPHLTQKCTQPTSNRLSNSNSSTPRAFPPAPNSGPPKNHVKHISYSSQVPQIPPPAPKAKERILLTKGNPGVISYYDEFLSTLHEDSPSTTILGLSLAGHEEYELSSPLSLQQQIENKVRILDMIISSPPFSSISPSSQDTKPKLVVMGHSVGAYMAFQVLKQRPQTVDHLFLLFPTISHIAKGSLFARFSSLITSIPGISKLLAWMTFLLRLVFPIPLLAVLLRLGHSLPGTSLTTTLSKFFNPSSVQNFCHLAKYEFKEIKELDIDSLRKYSKRITAYFAVKDRWVPPFARDQIMSIINTNGGDAIICNEGFPHAFSLGILPPLTSCFCKCRY
jgi:hypothetical protein